MQQVQNLVRIYEHKKMEKDRQQNQTDFLQMGRIVFLETGSNPPFDTGPWTFLTASSICLFILRGRRMRSCRDLRMR